MIFRTPCITSENPEDAAFVQSLGLECIFDFRAEEEIKMRPEVIPANCEYIKTPVFDGRKYRYIIVSAKGKIRCLGLRGKRIELLLNNKLDSYREMPFSQAYRKVFECMDEGRKFAFHCTEGKDRTGVCAALIEYCLGRDCESVKEQYLLSNTLRPNKDRSFLRHFGLPKKLLEYIAFCEQVHEELFDLSLESILKKYSSIDEYLEKEFGITQERKENWRNIYLED